MAQEIESIKEEVARGLRRIGCEIVMDGQITVDRASEIMCAAVQGLDEETAIKIMRFEVEV